MYETTIAYNNADGQCCFDDEIRATMTWWHGTEIDSGQDLDTHTRKITFAFGDESNAIKASRALEGLLGRYFAPVERVTRESVFAPNQSLESGPDAKAMDAGESLKVTWNAEVKIWPFGKALGGHASQDDLIIPNCGENR